MTGSYLTGAELQQIEAPRPEDVITSLEEYAINGGDINPAVYDAAIARCEPPMDTDQLQQVIDLAAQGIIKHHAPKEPIDYDRPGTQSPGTNETQNHFAALLGATSIRQVKLIFS